MKEFRSQFFVLAASLVLCLSLAAMAGAQSRDVNFPTRVTSNEINGTIKARDIGDSRLTSYYYTFDGTQGDVFINVVTKNFSGDIDVFTVEALRPLTKMVIYADSEASETGRLVYLRKNEHLILRVEGRTPNDDPATFRIKFAGSFVALSGQKTEAAPVIETSGDNDSRTKVNSVGTIIEVAPKTKPANSSKPPEKEVTPVSEKKDTKTTKETVPQPEPVKPPKTDSKTKNETVYENKAAKVTVDPVVKTEEKPAAKPPAKTDTKSTTSNSNTKTAKPPVETAEKKADPLASIRLVVRFKDGTVIEHPMSDVEKFGVEKGILTVITKDGKTTRHSILVVAKVTVE